MAVEKITPQLVKKGKGKKRPGYRGPGGYQGGASSRGGPPGGGATAGGSGRDFSGGPSKSSKSPSRSPTGAQELGTSTRTVNRITAKPPTTRIGGKKYNVTPETKGERRRAELKQQILNQTKLGGNRIDKFGNTKKSLFKQGGTGIGSLLASIFGMAMGIPGLGLLTGGFDKLKGGLGSLNDKIQSTDFAKSKTLMDYLDAKKYGGIDARDRAASKNMREARAIQTQMGLRPSSTMSPRDYAMVGLQTPQTFSDPFANTVGTTTKVNVPSNDAVSSYSYGTAGASIPNPNLAPTPVENVIQDAYSGIKNIGTKGNNFLDSLYNADLINQLGYQAFRAYPSDSATGPLSDARHMAAMNELSKSLSPMNNKFGNFIGDTLAIGAGAINEIPDAFKGFSFKEGFDPKAIAAAKEDLSANYAGTYGTPNTTSAQQIYDQVFNTNKFASGYADGGIASMFTRRG